MEELKECQCDKCRATRPHSSRSTSELEDRCSQLLASLRITEVSPEVARRMLFLREALDEYGSWGSWVEMVREFHKKYGEPIANKPYDICSYGLFNLRWDLHREEHEELDRVMNSGDLEGIADGIADLIYVLIGTALCYGIPMDAVFAEVHRSNMTKDGTRRADGKILKGESFEPPKIKEILDRCV